MSDLLADRFIRLPNGRVVDLATGEAVLFRSGPAAGDLADQAHWADRCAALFALRHPHLLEITDYGLVNGNTRFEAYRASAGGRSHRIAADKIVRSLTRWFRRRGLSAEGLGREHLVTVGSRLLCLPADPIGRLEDAFPATTRRTRRPGIPADAPDLLKATEVAVERVSELLETGRLGEPRAAALTGPPGTLKRLAVRAIARDARLRGFVPVSTVAAHLAFTCCEAPVPLAGRHVLLIHPAGGVARPPAGWLAALVLLLGTSSARPHLVLIVRDTGGPGLGVAGLDSLAGGLATGLSPWRSDRRSWPSGVPRRGQWGRYAPVLPILAAGLGEPDCPGAVEGGARSGARWVSEAHAQYGSSPATGSVDPTCPLLLPEAARAGRPTAFLPDPAHGTGGWQAHMRQAVGLVTAGRHAAAERLLRDVHGVAARRSDAASTAGTALVLGRLLLVRGRVDEAVRWFIVARDDSTRAEDVTGAVRAATYLGLAWTDAGRLAEAEAALRAAVLASRAIDRGEARRMAEVALARSLYWQGRFDAADLALTDRARAKTTPSEEPAPENRAPNGWCAEAGCVAESGNWWSWPEPDTAVVAACMAVRTALARGSWRAAGRAAMQAITLAERAAPSDRSLAYTASAAVYGGLGDLAHAKEHVQRGLELARRGHDPLRALRLRLVLIDAYRASGDGRTTNIVLGRLARLRLDRLPALLRARVHATLAVGAGVAAANARSALRAFVSTSGAHALQPPDGDARQPVAHLDATEGIVAVLQICQSVEDEQETLNRVCQAIRQRLRAAGVAVFGTDQDLVVPLAEAGPGVRLEESARRASDRGLALAPERWRGTFEASSPIHYAGSVIGSIACRWPVDVVADDTPAEALLAAAAAATAPLVRALLDRRATPVAPAPPDEPVLTGTSQAMVLLRRAIARAARVPFPVLVQGESGSGKELVARAIHRDSPRRHRKFCAFNCAALTDDLIEAELFGYARGAFTGAVSERIGLFEDADAGTLFLDEVADLSPRAQAKLLRVVQEGEVRRVGENTRRSIDVRIVTASNRPLAGEVESGRFRADLLYRLDVIRLEVPPLRERPEDIPLLASEFWNAVTSRIGSRATLAPATLTALACYDWPGNARELQNTMAALAVTAPRRGSVAPDYLPAMLARVLEVPRAVTLEEARRAFETGFVRAALARAGGHRTRAASALGLSRQGLAKLLSRLNLEPGLPEQGAPAEPGGGQRS